MLRTAEGLARSAVARLEFLGRGEKTTNNKKGKIEKDDVVGADAPMGPAAAAAGSAPQKSTRRRGRARKAAAPPLGGGGSLSPAEDGALPVGRILQPQLSRERSPRRDISPTVPSAALVPGQFGGFKVGQSVVLCGLTSRPELVNTNAIVMSFDTAGGRIAVKVTSTGETFKVKPFNITLTSSGEGGRQVL